MIKQLVFIVNYDIKFFVVSSKMVVSST